MTHLLLPALLLPALLLPALLLPSQRDQLLPAPLHDLLLPPLLHDHPPAAEPPAEPAPPPDPRPSSPWHPLLPLLLLLLAPLVQLLLLLLLLQQQRVAAAQLCWRPCQVLTALALPTAGRWQRMTLPRSRPPPAPSLLAPATWRCWS
jgi:hypothetical protein